MCFLTDPQYSGAPAPGQGGQILPGGGALNPFNPGSAANQAFGGVGEFNIFNPDSAVGKAANDVAKNLGTGLQAIANDPRKLAAVGIMVAFPGAASAIGNYLLPASVAASYPTMAAIVGQTALNAATNGGDVKSAVTNALIQQGAPQLTKYISDTYATEGISKAVTDWAAKATVDAGIASAMGRDPTSALLFSGAKAATDAVLSSTGIAGSLSMLPKEASSALKAAITAKIMNIDPSKAVAQDLINQAIGSAKGMVQAQWVAKGNGLPALTEDQLSKISPDAITDANGIKNFVLDAAAENEGWKDNYEKFLAAEQGITNPDEYRKVQEIGSGDFGPNVQGTVYSDGRYRPYGEDAARNPTADEAKTLKGFFERSGQDVPKNVLDALPKEEEPKGGLPVEPETPEPPVAPEAPATTTEPAGGLPVDSGTKLQESMERGKSGDFLGQINGMREIVGLPPFNSIEEYNAEQAAKGKAEVEQPVGGLPVETPEAVETPQPPTGGLPVDGEKPSDDDTWATPPMSEWEPQAPVGSLPTEPTLDNELELPEGINPTPVLDNELEPPSLLPTEPVLDNELEPPSTLPTEPVLDNELEPTCEPGYVFDHDSNSCVPDTKMPGTKPPATKPPATKPPATTPPGTTPPGTKPPTTTTPVTQPVTQTGGLPASTSPTIPWLDTKPQMLEVKGGAKNNISHETLQQLYNNVDPNLMSVFADRGFTPHGYSGGSSVTSVFSDFQSNLEKGTPKFAPVPRDAMISTGSRKAKQSGLSSSTQLAQLKSGLGGNAKGGLPAKYAQAAPKGHNPEFITGLTGFYANGRGTGQSDDIPAMLHDGDYVMDADTVAALGDGSSKAGALSLANFQKQVPHELSSGGSAVPAKIADGEYVFPEPLVTSLGGGDNKKGAQMLDEMREQIRAHKRSAPTSKIPPKAKSPLDYLKMVKG